MAGKFNSTRSHDLGKLKQWKKEANGITGETDAGKFRVLVYSDNVVRISLTRNAEFEDFSYAVVAQPNASSLEVTESNDHLALTTENFQTIIYKNPLRFSFLTNDGVVINEDDKGLGTSWNGEQVTTYKKLQEGERFIGLGEKTGSLDRRGHGYTNWNTDNFGYGSGADPLYSSVPFYIGVHQKLVYGIFFDNTFKTFFNFGASNDRFSSFAADAGEMNYYFIHGETVRDIITEYTHLTGRMELPPLWSIGYQQCRYSYYPDKEVLTVADTFREKDIPADTIVFDIHYMEKYKIFTWSKRDFPDPKGLLKQLKEKGFNVVLMCDPGIKVEPGYEAYDDGVKKDVFIKYPDGQYYTGQVWPGWCHFPDFTNPKARVWWKEHFQEYVSLGVQGFWNDMNEIATWGNMLPENIEMDFEGNKATMRRGRNIYGFQMARSTYEGTKALLKNRRPFNLTRSGFSGIQRYAAVWTGDNVAYDEHMMLGVRIVNSMGLSGIAFAGYDVGGFVGNADSKLFARWVSIGAFSPFFRGHSMINSRDSEPWSYGEEVEQISRNYIKFRYKLLPYLYSLFYEASVNGMPIQRSLAIDHPHDARVYDGHYQHQYLFGPFILVAPVESNKDFAKVLLPEGDLWYSVYHGHKHVANQELIVECPLHRLPVYIKGGAIIPMQPVKSHTGESNDVLILHVYSGLTRSSFTFYEDDGSSFDYQKDAFLKRTFEFVPAEKKIALQAAEGNFKTNYKKVKLVLHGFDSTLKSVSVNGKNTLLIPEINSFFAGLEKYDPIKDPEPAPEENVLSAEFEYQTKEIIIHW
ncbi:MAG TPA: glycoside hydrolase family 31 protein [Chryseosolibacter sp.]